MGTVVILGIIATFGALGMANRPLAQRIITAAIHRFKGTSPESARERFTDELYQVLKLSLLNKQKR